MDDKIPGTEEAAADTSNARHTPPPPPLSAIKRDENVEGGHSQGGCNQVAKNEDDPPHWTRYVEAACAILLVLITSAYTYYAAKQTKATQDAANAATSAATTASDSLKISREQFASSEAAVLQPNVSIRNIGNSPFVQIDILNSGHIAATHVHGFIAVPRHIPLHLSDITITTHSASPEYPSGFITRTVGLGNSPLDMKALAAQHFRVNGELDYWNGMEQIKNTFCYGLTVSPYTSAPDWQDCENQTNLQQTVR